MTAPTQVPPSSCIDPPAPRKFQESLKLVCSRQTQPKPRSRFWIFYRIICFAIIEGGFIALASVSITKPLPLLQTTTLKEVKAATTFLSIIWHSLATFLVKDIIVNVFSAEWGHQIRRSGQIVPAESDLVSRITTGYFDQIKHFLSSKSTASFRLAFIASLMLMAINVMGPSTLSIDYIVIPRPTKIKVGYLNFTTPPYMYKEGVGLDTLGLRAVDRAAVATGVEMIENSIYGLQTPRTNILIPWPSLETMDQRDNLTYESDIISYDYNCSWSETFYHPDGDWDGRLWDLSGHRYWLKWAVDLKGSYRMDGFIPLCNSAIFPLLNVDQDSRVDDPRSLFLFLGTTVPVVAGPPLLNLSQLPVTHSPRRITDSDCPHHQFDISILSCNPQYDLRSAKIAISNRALSIVNIHAGPPIVGNVRAEAANLIFAHGLGGATSNLQLECPNTNDVARKIFLTNTSFYPKFGEILPLHRINENMNGALRSAAKAYLGGYNGISEVGLSSSALVSTNATIQYSHLALAGSQVFVVALDILVGALIILLILLSMTVQPDKFLTFDLLHIIDILGVHKLD